MLHRIVFTVLIVMTAEYSIVIPAYRPVSLLRDCVSRIIDNTDLSRGEVIVVCNGSDRESADYILSLGSSFRLVWYEEAIGFTKASNIGFSLSEAPYCIIMNTDAFIEPSEKHDWINRLLTPFHTDPKVGVTGTTMMGMIYGDYFPFFCCGIRKSLFEEIGYLDMAFSPGYGEDADFCFRAVKHGYKLVNVANVWKVENNVNYIDFPVTHLGEGSFTDKEMRKKYIENQDRVLAQKWSKFVNERNSNA